MGTFAFSGLLFHWFTASGQDCGLNTFFIVMTLIFAFVFAIAALHPAVSLILFVFQLPINPTITTIHFTLSQMFVKLIHCKKDVIDATIVLFIYVVF